MKPIVTYEYTILLPVPGQSAVIGGIKGHPRGRFTGDVAQTTAVKRVVFGDGGKVVEFETENTIYRLEAKP